ncbi:hypothetical protein M501DRAFT_1018003 [Patellaria atrata CBS 101060]|uniref:Uncharacterized protein n=1 Tax=Patellaria atrata CBS 101060 TaxID=1346257 RepID=A0A9P4VQB1_9PEZI|nr:hypothetical protein M501DRAFT_1018003 [Patellaria atrata CBS 101060]
MAPQHVVPPMTPILSSQKPKFKMPSFPNIKTQIERLKQLKAGASLPRWKSKGSSVGRPTNKLGSFKLKESIARLRANISKEKVRIAPTHYPHIPFHGLRTIQLLSSVIVASFICLSTIAALLLDIHVHKRFTRLGPYNNLGDVELKSTSIFSTSTLNVEAPMLPPKSQTLSKRIQMSEEEYEDIPVERFQDPGETSGGAMTPVEQVVAAATGAAKGKKGRRRLGDCGWL